MSTQETKEIKIVTACIIAVFLYNLIEGYAFYKLAVVELSTLLMISICIPVILVLLLAGLIYPENSNKQEKECFLGILTLILVLTPLATLPGYYLIAYHSSPIDQDVEYEDFVRSYVIEPKTQECRFSYVVFKSTVENTATAIKRLNKSTKDCEKEYASRIAAFNLEKSNIQILFSER